MKVIKIIRKRWYIFLPLPVLFVLIYFNISSQSSKNTVSKTYTLKRENVEETLSLSGQIEASDKAEIKYPLSGKLAWIGIKEGDMVKANQVIAQLDATDAKKNLEKVLRDYSATRNDFEQTNRVTYPNQSLAGPLNDTAKRILEKNQWSLEQAVLDVELKDYALKLATITSPIAGIVTHIDNPIAGVNILATASIINVINPDSLYFSATVDQTDVVKIASGKTGKIIFDAYPEKEVEGAISSIAFTPKENETGTVYEVKIAFPREKDLNNYRLGMTGDVSFVTKTRSHILAVPTSAIKKENENKYVIRLVKGKQTKTFIKAGDEIDSKTEILNGLDEGDVIQL